MKLFKLTITAIIAVVLTLTYSCQQESLIEQDYSDMPYLSLPESTDFDNLSHDEMQTIMDAFERMGIHEDSDGLLQLKPRSGWEVNVSENIYQFFFELIDNSNQTNDIGAWNTMGDQYIIIIQEGGYLHAVNGIDKFGDNSFRYNDYQNNRQGIVLDHNVVGIYKVFRN